MSSPNVIVQSKYGPIIVNIYDKYITKSIVMSGGWADHEIELMSRFINILLGNKECITVYDVGANIGTHSLALSRLFGNKIFIRAFEAQSAVFNMLCGTIALNFCKNIKSYNCAISNVEDEIFINLPDYNSENNFGGLELIKPICSDNQDMIFSGTEAVRSITLDSFSESVDMIKIDVEGMENLVINGARKTIEKNRPICLIEVKKTDTKYVFDYFKTIDYTIYSWSKEVCSDAIFVPKELGIKIDGLPQVNVL